MYQIRTRLSSHKLSIEPVRWVKPNEIQVNASKCLFCNTLEDEYHFVPECQMYTDYRSEYIVKYYWN